jgi:hypothetical protein
MKKEKNEGIHFLRELLLGHECPDEKKIMRKE